MKVMPEPLTIAAAQAQLPEWVARLAGAPIVVMQADQPAIVRVNPDAFASLLDGCVLVWRLIGTGRGMGLL